MPSSIVDKNQAMWTWIKSYTGFDKLFYNFSLAEDNNKSFIPNPTEYIVSKDILGTKIKHYDFAITSFSRFSDIPYSEENVLDYSEMQNFINWIDTQNSNRSFPIFGDNCNIIEVINLQNTPTSSLTDQQIAKYMIQCRVVYEEY